MSSKTKPKPKTPAKPTAKKPPAKKPSGKKAAKPKPEKVKAAAKPPEPKWDSPEELAKFDAAFFKRGAELYDAMKAAQAEFLRLKEKAADAKKLFEASRIEHEEHTANGRKWRGQKPPGVQQSLPFEQADQAAATPPADSPAPSTAAADPNSELWRKFPLERWTLYGVSPSDLQKLREGKHKKGNTSTPITTVGELADFTAPFKNDPTRNYNYTDIKGIGPEGATRISDADIRFWHEWKNGGLAAAFEAEQGVSSGTAEQAGSGTSGGGGDGDKPRESGSARADRGGGKAAGKKAAKPKPKPAASRKTTPKHNASGVDPADPFNGGTDGQPATVPFEQPKPAAGDTAEATAV